MSDNKEYITQQQDNSIVHISEDTIRTVAAMAAVDVEGVAGLSHLGKDVAGIAAKKNLSRVVRLHTQENQLTVDISIQVDFDRNIRIVAQAVQASIQTAVSSVTGMNVAAVNIHVSGVAPKQPEQ